MLVNVCIFSITNGIAMKILAVNSFIYSLDEYFRVITMSGIALGVTKMNTKHKTRVKNVWFLLELGPG